MNSMIIKKTFFLLPLIYINHNREQILSYIKKTTNITLYNKYNKYNYIISYEINKKYYELIKKIYSS